MWADKLLHRKQDMSSLHLLGSRMNLAHIWEAARQELVRVLGQPDQKKVKPFSTHNKTRGNEALDQSPSLLSLSLLPPW